MTAAVKLNLLFLACMLVAVVANPPLRSSRTIRRLHIPFLGLGPRCTGCPPHFCDDDPAIVHGYCCGCSRFYDVLPVKCGAAVDCPLNNYDLCEDYEYMMHCCCE